MAVSTDCWMRRFDVECLRVAYMEINFNGNLLPDRMWRQWRPFMNMFVAFVFEDELEMANMFRSITHPIGMKKVGILESELFRMVLDLRLLKVSIEFEECSGC